MSDEPLRMYRGDSKILTVFVQVSPTDDTPVDISAMDLRFTAKYRTDDTDDEAIIVKTLDYGGISLGYETGQALVLIEPEDTAGLAKTTTLLWDFQLTDVAGTVSTAAPPPGDIRGRLIIYADVSITSP